MFCSQNILESVDQYAVVLGVMRQIMYIVFMELIRIIIINKVNYVSVIFNIFCILELNNVVLDFVSTRHKYSIYIYFIGSITTT